LAFSARDATGESMLWVRSFDGSPAQRLAGTEDSNGPFWSPDSRRVGFFAHRKLQVIDASGGRTTTLTDVLAGGGGGTWNREGTIVFTDLQGIYQVPASGGPTILLIRMDRSKFSFFYAPRFLPDGKHFIYGAGSPGSTNSTYFASLDGRENRSVLQQGNGHAAYASGFLLYCRGTTLVAQAFDPDKGQVTGTARPIEQIGQGALYSFFDPSQNGVLVYQPSMHAPTETQLAWFDRSGKRQAFIGVPAVHFDLRLSPDAGRLASSMGIPKSEMWLDDLKRGVRMRLTFDPETDKGIPVWSPNGNRILFSTLRGSKARVGIYEKASSGAGGEELLLSSDRPDQEAWATDWSRDGRFILFSRGDMANDSEADIWVLPLVGSRKPSLFLHAAAAAYDAQFSPDGRWVAYTSRESGRPEVYVAPFEATKFLNGSIAHNAPAGKWQISNNGGSVPRWRGDGKELFYIGPQNTVTAVEVQGKGTSFEVGRGQSIFIAPVSPFALSYDVTPDGKRFAMSIVPEEDNLPLTVMFNWTARLQAK
jgi:Tol biopolymer transport system component